MVEANEVGKTKVIGSSTSMNCLSKASTAESSLSSQATQGESSSASVALPPKKRNSVLINIGYKDQNNVEVVEEPRQINENGFPLKKRKSLYRGNVLGEEVQGNMIQDVNYAIEDDTEDKVDVEAKEKKEMGIQVSNPISLIAIAASWLADAEVVTEPIIPQAFAIVDESNESEISEEFDIYGNDYDSDVEHRNPTVEAYDQESDEIEAKVYEENKEHSDEQKEIVTEKFENKENKENSDEQKEIVSEKFEKKGFKKPRSNIPRRPKTSFTSKFNGITIFAVLSKENKHTKQGKEQLQEVQEKEDIKNDDLYSKVKKRCRRGRRMSEVAKDDGWSRCTRVNGKGWRCSSNTRVGFALCEHHLGRQEILPRMGGLHAASGKKKGKLNYRPLKIILDQTRVIEKW